MALDERNHEVPDLNEPPNMDAFGELSRSVRDAIPVASATVRQQKLAALAAKGIVPSASNPVWFYRADAPIESRLEVTEDGTNYRTYLTGIQHGEWTHAAPWTTDGLTGEGFVTQSSAEWGMGALQLVAARSENAPAAISGESLVISTPGIYSVTMTTRIKSLPPNQIDFVLQQRAYIQLTHQGGLTYRSVLTGDSLTTVSVPDLRVPTGGAVITPAMFQTSGGPVKQLSVVTITRKR